MTTYMSAGFGPSRFVLSVGGGAAVGEGAALPKTVRVFALR